MNTAYIAKRLSLSRSLFAVILLALYWLGVSGWLLAGCAVLMWLTDALDGLVARYGIRRGASQKTSGQILDPMMDDVALFAGFIILLDSGQVQAWFVAFLAFSRIVFSLVRQLSLLGGGQFAKPRFYTKLSGACLAIGQCILLLNVNQGSLLGDGFVFAVVCAMTATLAASVFLFLFRQHRKMLVAL